MIRKLTIRRLLGAVAFVVGALLAGAETAEAQELVYRPSNPAFGGNPLNQQWLLGTAQAQMPKEERDLFARDPLADFEQGLQRQILSAISREIVSNRFGSEIDLTRAGRYDLGEFVIEITPGLNGVDIQVVNAFTGDQTTVTIPSF